MKWISHMYIHVPALLSLPPTLLSPLFHPSRSSHSTELSSLSIRQVPTSCLFTSDLPACCTCPLSLSVFILLPCHWVHQCRISRLHIRILVYGICFSLSDLLCSIWQALGPSTTILFNFQSRYLCSGRDTCSGTTTSILRIQRDLATPQRRAL